MKVTLNLPEGGHFTLGKTYHVTGEVVGVEQELTEKQSLLGLLETYVKNSEELQQSYEDAYPNTAITKKYAQNHRVWKESYVPLIRALIEKVCK